MVNLRDAYRKDEQNILTPVTYSPIRRLLPRRGSVVTEKWDKQWMNEQKTNKRRTMNEQKTNNERRKDEQWTKKRRTMNEEKTNNERRKDKAKVEIRRRLLVEFILQRRRVYEDGVVLCAKNSSFQIFK